MIQQADFANDFLNGYLNREKLKLPQGVPGDPKRVAYKLLKALCGLPITQSVGIMNLMLRSFHCNLLGLNKNHVLTSRKLKN